MRPELEQAPLAPAAPGEAVEMAAVVAPQAREQRQVVGARQHVDGVDLQQPEAGDGAPDLAGGARAARRAPAKPWAASAIRRARRRGQLPSSLSITLQRP